MFELSINATNVAVSKDPRESAVELIDLLTDSPEWKKSMCVVEAHISGAFRERVTLLRDVVAAKVSMLGPRWTVKSRN